MNRSSKLLSSTLTMFIALTSLTAHAWDINKEVRASNNEIIKCNGDKKQEKYEYSTAPEKLDFYGNPLELESLETGAVNVWVGFTRDFGKETGPFITFAATYILDHSIRNYDSATFRGGDTIKVISKRSTDLPCLLGTDCKKMEFLSFVPTKEQIDEHTTGGRLKIKVSSKSGHATIIEVPLSKFRAIQEISALPVDRLDKLSPVQ